MSKVVHLHNISDSQLDVATVSLVLEKNQITSVAYKLETLQESTEIQKYQRLNFLKLLTPDEYQKTTNEVQKEETPSLAHDPHEDEIPSIKDQFFQDPSQSQQLKEVEASLQHSLDVVKNLLLGKPIPKKPESELKKRQIIPKEEQESSQGTFTKTSNEENKAEGSNKEDDLGIPNKPPKGMKPINEPAKRFLGFSPYSSPLPYQEKLKYLSSCGDIGILREVAIFEAPGRIKDMAKKKLREVESIATAGVKQDVIS